MSDLLTREQVENTLDDYDASVEACFRAGWLKQNEGIPYPEWSIRRAVARQRVLDAHAAQRARIAELEQQWATEARRHAEDRAALDSSHDALVLARARIAAIESLVHGAVDVVSIEWAKLDDGSPCTIITVDGTIEPVGAGDRIAYIRPATVAARQVLEREGK